MFVKVELPQLGAILVIGDKTYEIIANAATMTKPEDRTFGYELTVMTTLQAIDDEAEDLDEEPIVVNLDMIDYKEV